MVMSPTTKRFPAVKVWVRAAGRRRIDAIVSSARANRTAQAGRVGRRVCRVVAVAVRHDECSYVRRRLSADRFEALNELAVTRDPRRPGRTLSWTPREARSPRFRYLES